MTDEGPKIIIDEGWKAQVQREKEEAQRKAQAEAQRKAQEEAQRKAQEEAQAEVQADGPGQAAPTPLNAGADAAMEGDEYEEEGPPEASFSSLVASLATQAMMALGVLAPQGARQVPIHMEQARFTLETLAVLRQKTMGNLDEEEEAQLLEALSELQRIYMARVQQFEEQTLRNAGVDPRNLRP